MTRRSAVVGRLSPDLHQRMLLQDALFIEHEYKAIRGVGGNHRVGEVVSLPAAASDGVEDILSVISIAAGWPTKLRKHRLSIGHPVLEEFQQSFIPNRMGRAACGFCS